MELNLPPGAGATALVVADFNGDGLPDIAVANTGLSEAAAHAELAGTVSVFMNASPPGGVIAFDTRQDFDGGDNPTGIVAAGFAGEVNPTNGRPRLDLAVSDGGLDATGHYDVAILPGTGAPTQSFGPPMLITVGSTTPGAGDVTSPTGLAAGDLNGDQKPDLAVSGTNGLAVLLDESTPNVFAFAALANRLTDSPMTSVAVGRMDRTGLLDVAATTDANGGQVLVFQNDGAQTPSFTASAFAAGPSPRAVNLADLNGDGLADIAVVNDTAVGAVTVLRNTAEYVAGSGVSFAPAVTYSSLGDNPTSLALADVNQDGPTDAAVGDAASDAVAVIPGLTPGVFRTSSDVAFLQGAYMQLFHRPAGPDDLNDWLPQLPDADLAYLQGPAGTVSPLAVTNLDPNTDESFQLTFAPQVLDGAYTLFLGVTSQAVAIRDAQGDAMNQNGNLVNGEFPGDRFVANFAVSTGDDGAFISGLYHDLLGGGAGGRAADTNGFLGFLGVVDPARAQAVGQLAAAYVGLAESQDDIIAGLYQRYLRRTPGSSELTIWQPALAAGFITEQQITIDLLASAEYRAGAGDNNAAWLNRVYLDVLARPDAGDPGATAFLNQLDNGALTPAQAASAIVYSTEGLDRVVYATYVRLLDRAPGADELQVWSGVLSQGPASGLLSPFERLEAALVSSPEFFYLSGNSVKAWATAVYLKVLQRPAIDPNGPEVSNLVQAVLGQPSYTAARVAAVDAVLSSSEYTARLITQDFLTYLKTQSSASDVAEFEALPVPPGQSRDDYWLSVILADPRFSRSVTGQGDSNLQWLNAVYQDLLFRPASDAGAQNFLVALNGGVSRQQVASAILTSLEYRRDLVAELLDAYLARNKPLPQTGADAEVNAYAGLMMGGFTQEQVVALLASSPEYFRQSHVFP